MKRLRKSEYRVETMLRECRPRPSAAFLTTHAEEVRAHRPRRGGARRTAFAVALSAGMLAAFAGFGGIGYASSAAKHAVDVTKIADLVGVSSNQPARHKVVRKRTTRPSISTGRVRAVATRTTSICARTNARSLRSSLRSLTAKAKGPGGPVLLGPSPRAARCWSARERPLGLPGAGLPCWTALHPVRAVLRRRVRGAAACRRHR